MVEFAVQVVAAVVEPAEPGLLQVDGMNCRELLGQALTHPHHRLAGHGGRFHFIDVTADPFHHEERPSQDIAAVLKPQRPRNTNRAVLQCPQDRELAPEVVGFQQRGWFGTQPQHHIATGVPGYDREHHHLGGMPEIHPVKTLDADIVGIRQLGAQPGGQALGDVGVQRHWRTPSSGSRSIGVLSWVNADMSMAAQFG